MKPDPSPRDINRKALNRRLTQIALIVVFQAAILFFSSGTLAWGAAWAYLALYLAFIGLNAILILPKGTDLIEERSQVKKNAKTWDVIVAGIATTVFGPLILLISGLDYRFGWPGFIPPPLQVFAWLVVAGGYILFAWAMSSNPFFSSVVRIQTDRGHLVVQEGPYHFIRHPAYSGMILSSLFIPLQLGSWWGLLPAAVFSGLIIFRTYLEDRTLQAELPGYQAYTKKTHFRLLPGIW
jgi:protein-S-isoprenylcysteine O-methyltransferase Ste14